MERKTTVVIFQETNWGVYVRGDMDIATKENFKRETEFLLILFTQPLRSDGIWHNVNFLAEFNNLNSEFSFS